jgi:hypothetical protein
MIEFSKERPVETKLVRLRSGETLICCLQEFETGYVVEKPMSVTSVPLMDKQGMVQKVGVYLKDWIDYTDDTYFVITKDIVLVLANPDKKMVEDYIEAKIKSDIQRSEIELAETMQEYLQQMGSIDQSKLQEERDMGDESDYTPSQQEEQTEQDNDDQEEQDEEEDDGDDGTPPWWNNNPRVKF